MIDLDLIVNKNKINNKNKIIKIIKNNNKNREIKIIDIRI